MRLSEAIREGSRLAIQAFGAMSKGGGTCALGAAVEHLHMVGEEAIGEKGLCTDPLEARFTVMMCMVGLPCTCEEVRPYDHLLPSKFAGTLMLTVIHLNDRHMWSREAIAEWVETIENAQEKKDAETKEAAPAVADGECTVEGVKIPAGQA